MGELKEEIAAARELIEQKALQREIGELRSRLGEPAAAAGSVSDPEDADECMPIQRAALSLSSSILELMPVPGEVSHSESCLTPDADETGNLMETPLLEAGYHLDTAASVPFPQERSARHAAVNIGPVRNPGVPVDISLASRRRLPALPRVPDSWPASGDVAPITIAAHILKRPRKGVR